MLKPKTCLGCPLHHSGRLMLQGDYPPEAEVLILGSFPTQEDLARDKIWSGDSGKAMAQAYLPLARLERRHVALDHAIRCQPPLKKGKPAIAASLISAAISWCRQYDRPVDGLKLIIAQGPIALRKYYTGELKPHELRGHLLPQETPA